MELKNYQKQTLAKLAAFLAEAKVIGCGAAFAHQQEAEGYAREYAPLSGMEDVPYVCLRLPTGGGKTLLGSYIVKLAAEPFVAGLSLCRCFLFAGKGAFGKLTLG